MLILLGWLSLSSVLLQADWQTELRPTFLRRDAFDPVKAIPARPAKTSATEKKDLAELLRLQRIRTPEQCTHAAAQVGITLAALFHANGGPLTAEEAARWEEFFARVRLDTDYFVHQLKRRYARPRPYDAYPGKLEPCVKREVTLAYPSGHAAISATFAQVLGALAPDRAAAFEKWADQVAGNRVLGGVHYPSDIAAGKKLGQAVYDRLKANPEFQQALDQARSLR